MPLFGREQALDALKFQSSDAVEVRRAGDQL